MLLVLPIFYFGIFSAFSGTQFYDVMLYQTYNVIFTGMPVCWYAMYDWQFPKQVFMENPGLYKIGLKNKCFNSFVFWRWYFYATWQSFVILWITLRCLDSSHFGYKLSEIFTNPRDITLHNRGVIEGSVWIDGTYIMQATIVLVTVKIFVSTSSHTGWSIFFQLGCIVAFYVYLIIFTYVPASLSQILGVGRALLYFIENYLLLFITVIAFSIVDVGMWHIDQQLQIAYEHFEENLEEQE